MEQYTRATVPTTPYSFMGIKAEAIADADKITHEEWLAYRKLGIGGSDVGTIIGANPWKGVRRMNAEDIGLLEKEEAGESASWGTLLESTVAEEWSRRTGFEIRKVRKVLKAEAFGVPAIINLDYIYKDPAKEGWGVLEIKTASAYATGRWGTEEEPSVPESYYWQTLHYGIQTGLKYGKIVCLLGGQKLIDRNIEMSLEEYGRVAEALKVYFQASRVERRILQNNEIYRLSDESAEDDISASAELAEDTGLSEELEVLGLRDLYLEYNNIKAGVKEAEKRLDALKADIVSRMGEYSKGTYNGKAVVSLRVSNRSTLDKKAVAAAGIDLSPYTKETQVKTWYLT